MDVIIHESDNGTSEANNESEKFLNASSPTFLLPPLASTTSIPASSVTTTVHNQYHQNHHHHQQLAWDRGDLLASSADFRTPNATSTVVGPAVTSPSKAKAFVCDLDLSAPIIGAKKDRPYHHHLLHQHYLHHHHQYNDLQIQLTRSASRNAKSPTKNSEDDFATGSNSRSTASDIDMRSDYCFYRFQRFISRNPLLNYLLPICVIAVLVFVIYTFRDTAKNLLFWIETQNSWIVFVIFLCLFTIVSFPVTVGYLVLIISSGYLFGFIKGLLTVIIGANLGVAIAHNTIKGLQSKLPMHKLIRNETGRAILRVISGPRAFKIVLFARLTPIPFGLQNTIFGISAVNSRSYHTGTVIGLLPAQTINVYLGSKLRSIHEVLNDHNAALGLAGYGVFVVEVIVGAALMVWVIQKARTELSAALLSDMDSDEKILIEIEA
ncbi:transmembrane protein 64-like [Uranotaenia lowii]|uniref:transmembrane protein 64-like n=1 Tax=Uranotaenia lowii TaxID=190385 RepID=UPI00247A4DA3|nr:transmembrane protein 64-like [Uranotaenia lowii]XP_055595034.1 transmembrane protein 64-like [Uranotaenia lowii]XP_055595035.1 transmembrane protein 64-like [Uranotaenia lowii]XP_055595036.1 transmembrane protein 64-like [Uranotaenia lowii]XP_055595037.1 transmembrane protein 64-like [Uranotaenia lowii]XP_055595038.1 transmembrane protein 64-like [Uranotaenia lowii]